jgi:hypothetical protein
MPLWTAIQLSALMHHVNILIDEAYVLLLVFVGVSLTVYNAHLLDECGLARLAGASNGWWSVMVALSMQ